MSLPGLSRPLRILGEAGLGLREVNGRIHRPARKGAPVESVEVWWDPFRSYGAHTLELVKRSLEEGDGRNRLRLRRKKDLRERAVGFTSLSGGSTMYQSEGIVLKGPHSLPSSCLDRGANVRPIGVLPGRSGAS
jgi:hypothetical protein